MVGVGPYNGKLLDREPILHRRRWFEHCGRTPWIIVIEEPVVVEQAKWAVDDWGQKYPANSEYGPFFADQYRILQWKNNCNTSLGTKCNQDPKTNLQITCHASHITGAIYRWKKTGRIHYFLDRVLADRRWKYCGSSRVSIVHDIRQFVHFMD